jgi:hypothetical protein
LLHSTAFAVAGLTDTIKCVNYGGCVEEEQRMALHAYVFVLSDVLLQYFKRNLLALSAVEGEFVQTHRPPFALFGSEWTVELRVEARDWF